ncbi:uncharacterized protein EDB93DRAFT_1190260 [Suillus bovinus]|uniref:uncharacterized protein n=1 Tax=Suillus bovinus TaxID=48563 RepID=UPI001B860887|nr:uncharacterized protein EDB93DRAFT_1190260 [Suillus bovinus]KAG2125649.1 hypothetical protein EDB93DRAFT_1190260 [Suillus bovinus]
MKLVQIVYLTILTTPSAMLTPVALAAMPLSRQLVLCDYCASSKATLPRCKAGSWPQIYGPKTGPDSCWGCCT